MVNTDILYTLTYVLLGLKVITGSVEFDGSNDKFLFNRVEPGNELGITTKVIAHIHRPEKKLTETWRLNREFTPPDVVKSLQSMCDILIERKIKWNNCQLNQDSLTADLTYGVPEPKNKTIQYLELRFKPFERIVNGEKQTCRLAIVEENPAYFLFETFSQIPSNNSLPKNTGYSADSIHQHQLGTIGPHFLSIYGNVIDQDGIYNFDKSDYYEREEPYECFLSIGSSESAVVIEDKCPIKCEDGTASRDASVNKVDNVIENSRNSFEETSFHNEL